MTAPADPVGPASDTGIRQPAVVVTGLAKRFGGTVALDDVDLTIAAGTVHALLGGNGSGKSTTVKILAGVYPADAGTIRVGRRTINARHVTSALARQAGLRFVHQDLGLFEGMSVTENLALGDGFETAAGGRIAWRRQHARTAQLLERYEIPARPDTPVDTLRPAARTMVAIARALGHQVGDNQSGDGTVDDLILVLDEPTASLPAHEAAVLMDAVRRCADAGQTVVLISHRLQEVLDVADEITVLRDGRRVGTHHRADATESKIIEMMAGRTDVSQPGEPASVDPAQAAPADAAPGQAEPAAPAPAAPAPGEHRLVLRKIAAGPLRHVDLTVRAGEIVGLAGLLGSGRSTLLRAVFGDQPRRAGTIMLDDREIAPATPLRGMREGIAYVPEDRAGDAAFASLILQDNLSAAVTGHYWRRGRMARRAERTDARALMADFVIKAASPQAAFTSLSGGNQQKAVLARWLRRRPKVLLLDEPTQGVDVVARAEIYQLVRRTAAGGTAVLVASSDFEELAVLCDRVAVLRGGTVAAEIIRPAVTPQRLTELVHAGQPIHDQAITAGAGR